MAWELVGYDTVTRSLSSADLTQSYPTGTRLGDLVVFVLGFASTNVDGTVAWNGPWLRGDATLHGASGAFGGKLEWGVAVAGSEASVTLSSMNNVRLAGVIAAFRAPVDTTPTVVFAGTTDGEAASSSPKTLTAGAYTNAVAENLALYMAGGGHRVNSFPPNAASLWTIPSGVTLVAAEHYEELSSPDFIVSAMLAYEVDSDNIASRDFIYTWDVPVSPGGFMNLGRAVQDGPRAPEHGDILRLPRRRFKMQELPYDLRRIRLGDVYG